MNCLPLVSRLPVYFLCVAYLLPLTCKNPNFLHFFIAISKIFRIFAATQVARKGDRVKDIDGTEVEKAVCKAGLEGRFQNVIFFRLNFAT